MFGLKSDRVKRRSEGEDHGRGGLRILKGSSPEPLSATDICSRMVTYDPDLTRLLDRLETAGMVNKERDAKDRRVVNVHITKLGRDTVEGAMEAARARLHGELGGIGKSRLEQLADLLERVRGNDSMT